MDVLTGQEMPPNDALHHEDVFEHQMRVGSRPRVAGRLHVNIAALVPRAAAAPPRIRGPSWRRGSAAHTGGGAAAHRPTAVGALLDSRNLAASRTVSMATRGI